MTLTTALVSPHPIQTIRETPLLVTGLQHPLTPAAATPGAPPPVQYYPAEANVAGIEGDALVQCVYRAAVTSFQDCHVVDEQPVGQGFGRKAVFIVTSLVKPGPGGWPTADLEDGRQFQFPVQFRIKANAPAPR